MSEIYINKMKSAVWLLLKKQSVNGSVSELSLVGHSVTRPDIQRLRYYHLLFSFMLWQVQIPVFIAYNSLLIFFHLLLRFCIQTSLHELQKRSHLI